MPPRPKAICRKVACGALIDTPGYCEKHATLATGWVRSYGDKTSAQRGYGYEWQKTRERVLSRDCGLCQIKGPACRFIATEVDHKVSKANARALGWSRDRTEGDGNLQAACGPCHKDKTVSEKAGRV
jgi:5-methylcytosine-specific restriction protein A